MFYFNIVFFPNTPLTKKITLTRKKKKKEKMKKTKIFKWKKFPFSAACVPFFLKKKKGVKWKNLKLIIFNITKLVMCKYSIYYTYTVYNYCYTYLLYNTFNIILYFLFFFLKLNCYTMIKSFYFSRLFFLFAVKMVYFLFYFIFFFFLKCATFFF